MTDAIVDDPRLGAAAFAAGAWLLEELKQSVPIWKKENWADGTSQWVHPGIAMSAPQGDTASEDDAGRASGRGR